MKYEVITDTRGYCSIIRHTGTIRDFVELDLDDYNLEDGRLFAYKLGKNRLIWDETEWQNILAQRQQKADQAEVKTLKEKLNETDYIMARWGEDIMALDNRLTWIVDAIAISIKYSQMYRQTLIDRKRWRERIEELEND